MQNKFFFFIVEGIDDENFVRAILEPYIKGRFIKYCRYSQKKPRKVTQLINAISEMGNEYLFITDQNSTPCITTRKDKRIEKYKNLDKDKIVIVQNRIEDWYIAGLSDVEVKRKTGYSFKFHHNISKAEFYGLTDKKFNSESILFKQEILRDYDIDLASKRNESFQYLRNKIENME